MSCLSVVMLRVTVKIMNLPMCMRNARHFCRILKASNVKLPSSPTGINRFDTTGRRDGEI